MVVETLIPYLHFLKADLALLETVFRPKNIKIVLKQHIQILNLIHRRVEVDLYGGRREHILIQLPHKLLHN